MAKLNPVIADKYTLLNAEKQPQIGGYGRFGTIDYSTLTEKQAENLLLFGFPHLERVKIPIPKTSFLDKKGKRKK